MEPLGQQCIVAGIADEDRVVLNRVHHLSSIDVDPLVGHACTTQEVQGAPILGELNRVEVNIGRPEVFCGDESFDQTKIIVGKNSLPKSGIAHIGIAEIGAT